MDSNLVEAVQAVQSLENEEVENYYAIEASAAVEEEEGRAGKRQRLAIEPAASGGPGSGLMGGDAMENLKYFADLARKQAEEDRIEAQKTKAVKTAPAKKAAGLGALGGYGSDSD